MWSIMSWIVAAAARARRARRAPELLPLSLPLQVHIADQNRVVPASSIPLQTMPPESELRNRLPQPLSTRTAPENEESQTDSAAALTPTSSDDTIHSKDSSTATAWYNVLVRLISAFSSDAGEKERAAYDHEHGYDRIKKVHVEALPKGFPQLAEILSSNDDWAIFRGFKSLHARILAQLQVDLTKLEEELRQLDKRDDHTARYRLRKTGQEKEGVDTSQRDLLDKIKTRVREYDEFLLNNAQIQALGRPPQRNYRSVFNWVFTRKPLCPDYYDFIYYADDFVSTSGCSERDLRSEQSNWFQELIRSCISCRPFSGLRGLLKSKTEVDKTKDSIVHHYSSFRLAVLSKILLVSLAVGVLLAPVFLLFLVSLTRLEMALIVFAFVLLFCVMMSITSDAKTQEVLMGTAAYAAVLVTFLGNLNGNQGFVSGSIAA